MTINGTGGAIAAGSRHIADLAAWRLSRENGSDLWTLSVDPVDVDTFQWSVARDARISLAFGERRWVWTMKLLPTLTSRIEFVTAESPETYP